MSNSGSPIAKLRREAEEIARRIKAIERGEVPNVPNVAKLVAARQTPQVTFGIMQDDKLISMTLAWSTIAATGEHALAEMIVHHMRGGTTQ